MEDISKENNVQQFVQSENEKEVIEGQQTDETNDKIDVRS